ncbi:glycosyltransferase family 1 protein [Frigoribacterium sp. CG_9.8]|uniref:glycosyltransferase family 4 protein n=1 Tax=Frigoribacterium sp. CG_9.8 TaxID=2787733 RepID=UPI0018C950E1|nr:glycosyltransferase family 1 protein [Frigoribacterium sp. CG_9.8]MBG6107427.1 phosphatidylinositol alpha 1,6-mannosyltransferase [Frigoribacterium sp. CG_9.8]
MRIAIVAETYLPLVNGVTHSLQRVLEHLVRRGDEVLVIAPSAVGANDLDTGDGVRVVRLPSVSVAGYSDIRLAVGGVSRVRRLLADFAPDVVHLASPFELGRRAMRAADQLDIPTVAVYQTDVPGYLGKYGLAFLEAWAWQRVIAIHQCATRTLAPSLSAARQLELHGIPRVELWGRGVDTTRFHPGKRSAAFRAEVAPNGELLIGYVGRLAVEKQVEDLAALAGIGDTRLVIVGDGPERETLEALLPEAYFTGLLGGEELAIALATVDLLVHPGELETFCQTIQEAMASGVPVVATARGGPVDLVDSSRTGWLHTPGDLGQLRRHVMDLIGDDAKRAAFGEAAFESVQGRTWPVVCELLIHHFECAITQHALLLRR